MLTIFATLDDDTEIILVTVPNRLAVVDHRLLARNKVSGEFTVDYLSKLGYLDNVIEGYQVVAGEYIKERDTILVDKLKAYNKKNSSYFVDVCICVNPDGTIETERTKHEGPQQPSDCRKIVATTDTLVRKLTNMPRLGIDLIKEYVTKPLYISREMLEEFGFKVKSDDGQCVTAYHRCEPGMPGKDLQLNREGNWFGLKTDGGTRTLFSGFCETWDQFKLIFHLAR